MGNEWSIDDSAKENHNKRSIGKDLGNDEKDIENDIKNTSTSSNPHRHDDTIAYQDEAKKNGNGRFVITPDKNDVGDDNTIDTFETNPSLTKSSSVNNPNISIQDQSSSPQQSPLFLAKNDDVNTNSTSTAIFHTLSMHDEIGSVAYSPDGKFLASGGRDKKITIVEMTSNEIVATLPFDGWVRAIEYSPNNKYLAGGGGEADHDKKYLVGGGDDNIVKVYHPITHKLIKELEMLPGSIWSISFSKLNTWMAVAGWEYLLIFDVTKNFEIVHHLKRNGHVYSTSFSPIDNNLIAFSNVSSVYTFDIESKTLLQQGQHNHRVWALCFSTCGNFLYAGGEDKQFITYEMITTAGGATITTDSSSSSPPPPPTNQEEAEKSSQQKQSKIFSAAKVLCNYNHYEEIATIICTNDGKYIIIGEKSGYVSIYDAAKLVLVYKFKTNGQVNALAQATTFRQMGHITEGHRSVISQGSSRSNGTTTSTTPDSESASQKSPQTISSTMQQNRQSSPKRQTRSTPKMDQKEPVLLSQLPEESYLAIASDSNLLFSSILDLFSNADKEIQYPSKIQSLKHLPNSSKILAVVCGGSAIGADDKINYVEIHDIFKERHENAVNIEKIIPGMKIKTMDVSPDGSAIVLGCENNNVMVYNAPSFQLDENATEKLHQDAINTTNSSAPSMRNLILYTSLVRRVKYSSLGNYIAIARNDQSVILYDASTYDEIRRFSSLDGDVMAIAICEKANLIKIGLNQSKKVRVYHLTSEKNETKQPSSEHSYFGLRYRLPTPENNFFGFGADHRRSKPEIRTNGELHHHDHVGYVLQTKISPDGKLFALSGKSNVITLCNILSSDRKTIHLDHATDIVTLEFSPDGKILGAGSANGVLAFLSCNEGRDFRLFCEPLYFPASEKIHAISFLQQFQGEDATLYFASIAHGKSVTLMKPINPSLKTPVNFLLKEADDDRIIDLLADKKNSLSPLSQNEEGKTLMSLTTERELMKKWFDRHSVDEFMSLVQNDDDFAGMLQYMAERYLLNQLTSQLDEMDFTDMSDSKLNDLCHVLGVLAQNNVKPMVIKMLNLEAVAASNKDNSEVESDKTDDDNGRYTEVMAGFIVVKDDLFAYEPRNKGEDDTIYQFFRLCFALVCDFLLCSFLVPRRSTRRNLNHQQSYRTENKGLEEEYEGKGHEITSKTRRIEAKKPLSHRLQPMSSSSSNPKDIVADWFDILEEDTNTKTVQLYILRVIIPSLGSFESLRNLTNMTENDAFNTLSLQAVIDANWKNWGKNMYLRHLGGYVIWLVSFTLFCEVSRAPQYYFHEATRADYYFNSMIYILGAAVFRGLIYFSYFELRQIRSLPWEYYSNDGWNYWQWMSKSFIFVTFVLRMVSVLRISQDIGEDVIGYFSAVALFLSWIGLFSYMGGFEEIAWIVTALVRIAASLVYFMLVIVLVVISFTVVFRALALPSSSSSNDVASPFEGSLRTFPNSVLATFIAGIVADFELEEFQRSYSYAAVMLLLVLLWIIVLIIALNALIAFIGERFEYVLGQRGSILKRQKSLILVELYNLFSEEEREKIEEENKWTSIVVPAAELNLLDLSDRELNSARATKFDVDRQTQIIEDQGKEQRNKMDDQAFRIEEQAKKIDDQANAIKEQAKTIDEQAKQFEIQGRKIELQARKIDEIIEQNKEIRRILLFLVNNMPDKKEE